MKHRARSALVAVAILWPALARAQTIDRSCVHEVEGSIGDRLRHAAITLPATPASGAGMIYRELQARRQQLSRTATQVEREVDAIAAAHRERLVAQEPTLARDQAALYQRVAATLIWDPDYDRANARGLRTQIAGYNETEFRMLKLLSEIPEAPSVWRAHVSNLATVVSAPAAAGPVARTAFEQLQVIVEAGRQANSGLAPATWMLTRPPAPEGPVPGGESARELAALGFDSVAAMRAAAEFQFQMSQLRAQEDRVALDVGQLPRFVPPAPLRQQWAQPAAGPMPETRREASAAVAGILARSYQIDKARDALRRLPPPPPPATSAPPATWVGEAKQWLESAAQTVKRRVIVLE